MSPGSPLAVPVKSDWRRCVPRLPGATGDELAEGVERRVRFPGAFGHEVRSVFIRGFSLLSFQVQVLGGCLGQGEVGASGPGPNKTAPALVVELSDERLVTSSLVKRVTRSAKVGRLGLLLSVQVD